MLCTTIANHLPASFGGRRVGFAGHTAPTLGISTCQQLTRTPLFQRWTNRVSCHCKPHRANNSKFIFEAVIDKATRKAFCKPVTEPPCKPSIRASHGVLKNNRPQGLLSKYQQHHSLLPYKQLYSRTWCCTSSSKPLDQLLRKIMCLKA